MRCRADHLVSTASLVAAKRTRIPPVGERYRKEHDSGWLFSCRNSLELGGTSDLGCDARQSPLRLRNLSIYPSKLSQQLLTPKIQIGFHAFPLFAGRGADVFATFVLVGSAPPPQKIIPFGVLRLYGAQGFPFEATVLPLTATAVPSRLSQACSFF
jgi:hypothetical protein